MKRNIKKKLLLQDNENSCGIEESNNIMQNNNKKTNTFLESLKNVENEETNLLKLQKQYRNGEINEKHLSEEELISLCRLYDKQILNLKKSNEYRKKKLLEYRKKFLAAD